MSLRRGILNALPISLGLWLALAGAGVLTCAWFATLAEQADLPDRKPFLPQIPQRTTP